MWESYAYITTNRASNVLPQWEESVDFNGVAFVQIKSTVLDIKRVENAFFHSMYIFSVILHAIDKQDIST